MIRNNLLRVVAVALALAAGSAVQAQATSPSGPGNSNSNKAGEAFPNDPAAADPNKPKAKIVQRAENSRPVKATKRATKRAANAVKRAGSRAANAVRKTGEKIGDKIPPGPNDQAK